MWRERIQNLTKAAVFNPPVDEETLSKSSMALNVVLPVELQELLAESDGVNGEYGLGLIWNCERILTDNLNFRNNTVFSDLYMPFDTLLFFADAGNGDQFAFPIQRDGQIHRPDVFVWNHENDSRAWVAPSLEMYLDWWLTGKITI